MDPIYPTTSTVGNTRVQDTLDYKSKPCFCRRACNPAYKNSIRCGLLCVFGICSPGTMSAAARLSFHKTKNLRLDDELLLAVLTVFGFLFHTAYYLFLPLRILFECFLNHAAISVISRRDSTTLTINITSSSLVAVSS